MSDGFGDDDAAARAALRRRAWHVATFTAITIILIVIGAVVLLTLGSGEKVSLADTPFVGTSTVQAGPSPDAQSSSTPPSKGSTSVPQHAWNVKTRSHPPAKQSSSSASSSSFSSGASGASTSRPAGQTGHPSSSSTTRHTTTANPPPPPNQHVELAKASPGPNCHQRCYYLSVTLIGFLPGSHFVECYSSRNANPFAWYSTTGTISVGCTYQHSGDSVWVVVDNVTKSNVVHW